MENEKFFNKMTPEQKNEEKESVSIRTATLEDMPTIDALYRDTYGQEWHILNSEEILDPASDMLVAVNTNNEVVGVARLTPAARGSHFYQFGGLIVRPDCHGKGIGGQLTEVRLNRSKERGAVGIFSEPVCFRPNCESQYNLVKNGFVLTGLSITKYPHIQNEAGQPETTAIAFKFLSDDQIKFGNRRIYLPDEYRQATEAFLPNIQNGEVGVESTMPTVEKLRVYTTREKMGSEFIDVGINWPESIQAIEELRGDGYLFAGIMPGVYMDEEVPYDALRMYKPPANLQIDFDRIYVHPQLKILHDFIRTEFSQRNENK